MNQPQMWGYNPSRGDIIPPGKKQDLVGDEFTYLGPYHGGVYYSRDESILGMVDIIVLVGICQIDFLVH